MYIDQADVRLSDAVNGSNHCYVDLHQRSHVFAFDKIVKPHHHSQILAGASCVGENAASPR